MKKHYFYAVVATICTLLTLSPFTTNAQVLKENRIEFEQGEEYELYTMYEFGENGLLLTAKEDKTNTRLIQHYNTDLVADVKKEIDLPKGYYLTNSYTDDLYLYLFYTDRKYHYIFYRIEANTLEIKKSAGMIPKKHYLGVFVAAGDYSYVSLRSKKATSILKINIESGKSSLIPIEISPYTSKSLSVENIQIMKETNEVMIYINALNKRDHNLFVIHYGTDGKEISTFNLSSKTEKKLSSVSASQIGENDFIFTGTYSSRSAATSEGMYMCMTNGDDIDFMEFYNFTDFEDFFSYLPERKQEKIEKKKARAEDNNKELSYNYYMAEHPITRVGDQFLMIAEAYYPTYRQEARTTTSNGRTTTTYVTVFDGYQYTHATVALFDSDGKKLWDRTLKMYPGYKPFVVKRFISESVVNDQVNLLFSSGNSIISASYDLNGQKVKDKKADLIVEEENTKVKASYANIEFWYDTHFIAHGYQTIKDKEESFGNKKRRVYFINKITYE
jgi:hypothetical protein